jgi:3-methyladenine DNA glycosylase AlkD
VWYEAVWYEAGVSDLLDAMPYLRADLTALADTERAAQMSAYLQNRFSCFGVSTVDRRRIARPLLHAASASSSHELLGFAAACWDQPEREFQYIGSDLLRRWSRNLVPEDLPTIEIFVRSKSWWDTVDQLAAWVVGPLVAETPDLALVMDRWISDENIWIARTALLHQLSFKEHTDVTRLFAYAEQRAADREFFLRKAIGWALRQYARTDAKAVRAFVARNEASLSGLTKREALKHLGESAAE